MLDLRHASSNHPAPTKPNQTNPSILTPLSFPPKEGRKEAKAIVLPSIPSPRLMDEKASSRPPTKKGWFDWQSEQYCKEMLVGFELSNRSSGVADLLQNCDLPPPLKLFSPIEDDDKKSKINPIGSTPLVPQNSHPAPAPTPSRLAAGSLLAPGLDQGGENPNLLRAVQLSQTRAREAEKQATLANARNEKMASLLLEDSLRLSAHRRWVSLLEMEVSLLREKISWSQQKEEHAEDDDAASPAAATWCLTLAICLGIAGVGFALGCLSKEEVVGILNFVSKRMGIR